MKLAAKVAQERAALVGQRRCQPGGRIERLRDLEEVGGIEATATPGALDPRADVVGRSDPDSGPLVEQGSRLVGLVEATRDENRVCGRFERFGEPAARGE